MEMVKREGIVAMAIGNGRCCRTEGRRRPRLGTKPIEFGFRPRQATMYGISASWCHHARRGAVARSLGEPRRKESPTDNTALRPRDRPRRLQAPIAPGGHRGSGLAMVVQAPGGVCDAPRAIAREAELDSDHRRRSKY